MMAETLFGSPLGDISLELAGLAVDLALAGLFHWGYRRSLRSAISIEEAPNFTVGHELRDALKQSDGLLPYVCLTGIVEPQVNALHSNYRNINQEGVVQRLTLIEHHTKRQQGFWIDCKTVLRDAVNYSPFKLVSANKNYPEVLVSEPLAAESLIEHLHTTFDKYTPNKTSVFEKSVDRVFGDVPKGVQETEQMLTTGVYLLGIGKVVLNKSVMTIMPPNDDTRPYILTQLTKNEVLKVLRSKTKVFKFVASVFHVVGLAVVAHLGYLFYKKWKSKRDMLAFMELWRSGSGEEENGEEQCVICLAAPRNIVILNCGHICICAQCENVLPRPKTCPICREPVERSLPIYRS